MLFDRLVPEFCSDPRRQCDVSGFRAESIQVSEYDARHFVRALDHGLVDHQGNGLYRMPNSATCEQFFWEGPTAANPRRFTLWLEPIITIATVSRLHFEFGWPKALIGTQSVDWAFDVVTRLPGREGEFIAGEIKKSATEVHALVELVKAFGNEPSRSPPSSGKSRNAYKKAVALRSRQAPLFWAVGPNGLSEAFQVEYDNAQRLRLVKTTEDSLRYPQSD